MCCAGLRQVQLLKPASICMQELCQKIIKGVYNTPGHISPEVKDLLARMLTVVPDHRITFEQVGLCHCQRSSNAPFTMTA